MKAIAFLIFILLLLAPFYFIHANDRKEPDYVFYEAQLSHIDKPSKLLAGKVSIKMDIDHTFLLVNMENKNLSSSIKSISIHGPVLEQGDAPIIFQLSSGSFKNQKITITEDQAEDIAQGLYYVLVTTTNNPRGELRGRIETSSETASYPKQKRIDFTKFKQDMYRYAAFLKRSFGKLKSTSMNMKQDSDVHPLSENIRKQLSLNVPTLLLKYSIYKQIPDYKTIAYRPRQFDTGLVFGDLKLIITNPGVYKGWDFLNAPQWITLHLSRPATVGIIWRGGTHTPQWLSSWTRASSVQINNISYPVFTKVYSISEVILGSVDESSSQEKQDAYLIVLAEEKGVPSSFPVVPDGLERPIPNKLCPPWVHDQYVTKGPDGNVYATWHPQIDPVFWCYFGHEHGTDPKEFDKNITLPFGYAGSAMGMHEKHVGFKVYVWDDTYGYRILALQHQGTSTNQAVCGRYHELDFFVKKKKTDKILAKRYFVGDYGVSRSLVTGKPFINPKCPDQKSISSSGARFLPVEDERKTTESWVVDDRDVIGFNFADFVVSTLDSVRLCKDYVCDTGKITQNTGSLREISYVSGLGSYSGIGYSGTFYTDPTGTNLLKATDPHAVEQFTEPWTTVFSDLPQSVHLYNSTHCYDKEGFGSRLTCGIDIKAAPVAREDSIRVPN